MWSIDFASVWPRTPEGLDEECDKILEYVRMAKNVRFFFYFWFADIRKRGWASQLQFPPLPGRRIWRTRGTQFFLCSGVMVRFSSTTKPRRRSWSKTCEWPLNSSKKKSFARKTKASSSRKPGSERSWTLWTPIWPSKTWYPSQIALLCVATRSHHRRSDPDDHPNHRLQNHSRYLPFFH